MYFRLHIHKLRRSITRTALVSETTNIITCDALTTPSFGFRYLVLLHTYSRWNMKPGPGNCNRVQGS